MIGAIFLFNLKGEILISRVYRPDIKRNIADLFRVQVINNTKSKSPILTTPNVTFFHVLKENVYVVALSQVNVNVAFAFELIYKFISLCESYFDKLDEESVKNNFTLIYELLDGFLIC